MRLTESEDSTAKHVADANGKKGVQTQPEQERQQQFWQEQYRRELAAARPASTGNVRKGERVVSVAAGAIVALLGLRRGTLPGLAVAGAGSFLVYRGVTGRCPAYQAAGISTASDAEETAERGVQIATSFTINKPREELYRFWRNFENLPGFMEHLESVRVIDERKSHWVVKAPRLVGGKVEWDAEVTRDEANELIAWRSLPGSTVDTAGQVRFRPALGDRGTEVHVWMNYTPPGGRLGHWVTSLLGENPKRVVREDLRNFKRIMEIGEILTVEGQQRGTCTGWGKQNSELDWKPLFT